MLIPSALSRLTVHLEKKRKENNRRRYSILLYCIAFAIVTVILILDYYVIIASLSVCSTLCFMLIFNTSCIVVNAWRSLVVQGTRWTIQGSAYIRGLRNRVTSVHWCLAMASTGWECISSCSGLAKGERKNRLILFWTSRTLRCIGQSYFHLGNTLENWVLSKCRSFSYVIAGAI